MVTLLLEFGADVNCRNADGITPLMFSCQRGCSEVSRTLVQNGAEVNAIDNSDKSALIYAAEHGHLEIVELLVACDWHTQANQLGLIEAAQQATVTAAAKGNIQVIFLSNAYRKKEKQIFNFNRSSSIYWTCTRSILTAVTLSTVRLHCVLPVEVVKMALVWCCFEEGPH